MRVYHFINERFGLDDIKLRRLKIARINELNDPFELLAANFADETDRAVWRDLKARSAQAFGLICFSKSWRNPVQWSHYSERNRGMCLGFDVPAGLLKSVSYSRNRLPWERYEVINNQQAGEDFIERVLSTKFSHWRYEQEMRLFVRLDRAAEQSGFYYMDFSPELALKEVIVGSSSSVSRSQIEDALGNLAANVRCWKARLAFKSFRVVKQRKASLWS